MRLKLVIAASVLAAVVGAGICIALVLGVFSARALSNPGLLVTSTLLLPIATITFASIFVYRHTARRRKLQAFLTAILAIILTLGLFIATSILTGRYRPLEPRRPVDHIAT
jgi:purine-cytosine permease-like protein